MDITSIKTVPTLPNLWKSGKFGVGSIHARSGRARTFEPITEWANGVTMIDRLVDGTLYVKALGQYYREVHPTGHTRRVNVLELGLKADGITRNELILAAAMRILPIGTTFFFPASPRAYLFGALPPEYNDFYGPKPTNYDYDLNPGIPVAINCDYYGSSFEGEGTGSVIQLLPKTQGILIQGGITPIVPLIKNLIISGPGIGSLNDGKDSQGNWSRELGDYKYCGIAAYSQVRIEDVNIVGCSGYALKIFGFNSNRPKGIPIKLKGKLEISNDNQYYIFTPTTDYNIANIKIGWEATLQGKITLVPFNSTNEVIYLNPQPGFILGDNVEVTIRPFGGRQIADNSDIYGGNFDFNGGAVYIQGDDGNQTKIFGLSFRENIHFGIADLSFLGSFGFGCHGTANGKGFPDKTIGSYLTQFDTARSSWYGCYSEGGNQGYNYMAAMARLVDGIHEVPMMGNGTRSEGMNLNRLGVGGFVFDGAQGMTLPRLNDSQPLTFKFFPWGTPGIGYGGSRVFTSFIREGESIFSEQGTINEFGRQVAPFTGSHTPTQYIGPRLNTNSYTMDFYLNNVLRGKNSLIGDEVTMITGNNNSSIKYICIKGGDPSTCEFEPMTYLRLANNDRPPLDKLTRHDIGLRNYDKTIGWSTFNGTVWIND